MDRRSFLGASILALFGGASLGWRHRNTSSEDGPRIGIRRIPNVPVQTHEGRWVRFYDDLIRGRIVLVGFMYARCERTCPRTTSNLVSVQRRLGARMGREVFFYSITLKPTEDTPVVLHRYARSHGVGPGWLFLTGEPGSIERLRRTLGFTDPDPILDADESQHIGMVLCGNDALGRWAACPALSGPERIAEVLGWMGTPAVAT